LISDDVNVCQIFFKEQISNNYACEQLSLIPYPITSESR